MNKSTHFLNTFLRLQQTLIGLLIPLLTFHLFATSFEEGSLQSYLLATTAFTLLEIQRRQNTARAGRISQGEQLPAPKS